MSNINKYTTKEVLNKVLLDSSGNAVNAYSHTSQEAFNAALDDANSRLNVNLVGGTIGGDVTISGDLTVNGSANNSYDEIVNGQLVTFRDDIETVGTNENIVIENDGSGDASLKFSLTGATDWFAYVDNSDSDKFKIRRSTTDHLSIDESGNATFGGTITASNLPASKSTGESFAFGTNSGSAFLGDSVNKINVAIGSNAGTAMADYGGNVFIGKDTAKLRTRGDNNVAIGTSAGGVDGDDFGDKNVFIGLDTGKNINSVNADSNVMIGNSAGTASTVSIANVLIGDRTGSTLNDSRDNVAIGTLAGTGDGVTNTTTSNGIYLGYYARSNATNASNEIVIGSSVTGKGTGTINIGNSIITSSTTIFGKSASSALQQGDFNTAIGYEALLSNIDGGDNTAVGYRALAQLNIDSSDTSPAYNTAVGARALDGITTGTHNTAIGSDAMGSADGGETENTAIGYRAMFNNNNGLSNTCIGAGTNLSAVNGQGQIAIGKDVSCIANETATLGFGSNVASLGLDGSDTSWAASSDERLKENIVDSTAGLDVINDLRPVTYNWKKAKNVDTSMPQYKDSDEPVLGKEYGESLHGFIAQEVKVVIDNHDSLKEGFKMWKQSDDGTQTIADGNLIPILVKAVQELSARVKELESK
jgi:hypothetical protein